MLAELFTHPLIHVGLIGAGMIIPGWWIRNAVGFVVRTVVGRIGG